MDQVLKGKHPKRSDRDSKPCSLYKNQMNRKYLYLQSKAPNSIDILNRQNDNSISKILEERVGKDEHVLDKYGKCSCQVCNLRRTTFKQRKNNKSSSGNNMLEEFINCLAGSQDRIEVNIPQICFFGGQGNGILWSNNLKTGFVEKQTAFITERNLFQVFNSFQNNNQQTLGVVCDTSQTKMTRKQINQDDYDQILPTIRSRMQKFQERKLVLYRNREDRSSSRVKESQLCLVKYMDGNFQLLNRTQFRIFTATFAENIGTLDYVQSYIKPKTIEDSTILVDYDASTVSFRVLDEVTNQLAYSLDQIYRLEPQYLEPEEYKLQYCQSKMPRLQFLKFKTCELVVYVEKTSFRKTKCIKIHWTLSQDDVYYVYDILEWQYQDKLWPRQSNVERKAMQSCLEDKFPRVLPPRQSKSLHLVDTTPKSTKYSPNKSIIKRSKVLNQIRQIERSVRPARTLFYSEREPRQKYKLQALRFRSKYNTPRKHLYQLRKTVDLTSRLFS